MGPYYTTTQSEPYDIGSIPDEIEPDVCPKCLEPIPYCVCAEIDAIEAEELERESECCSAPIILNDVCSKCHEHI